MKLKSLAIFSAITTVSFTAMIPMAAQANVDADCGSQKLSKGELLPLNNNSYVKAKDEGGTSTKPERNWDSSNSDAD